MGVRTYGPFALLSSGDMSGDLESAAIDMLSLPFGAIEAVWTGSPTGTLKIEGSIENVPSAEDVTRWYDTGTSVGSPAGSGSSTLVNLAGVGFRWLRVVYERSGGSGSLDITGFGKGGFSG